MDSFWIICLLGFLTVFDGCQSIYEINAKRTLDAQTHWRPISSSIGVQGSSTQRFFSLPNLDTGKYRIGQLNNNNPYVFRHVKSPSPPHQQYRNPFSFYQKANNAFLGVQKPSQKFLATSTSHAVFGKHELPSLMNPHYYNDFHSSANIAPAFKPFPVLKSPNQQNLGLHNPLIYRDIALPHPHTTQYPALIQHQSYNTHTTPKIAYENNKTPLRFPVDALSSYSFFGPAAHLVRNQNWPSQGALGNLPEASFKASSTALPAIIPSTSFRLNLLPSSSSTSTTENSYNWDTTRNPINFEQETDTRNTGEISQNINWSHTPDPLTQDEFSKILVPPPPFLTRENFKNISEPDRGHQNISPFGDPKDVIISNQNFISTSTSTSRTPNEHFTIKSESSFPANNRDVFSNLNIALTTEKPNTFNFNHVNQIINELEKVKAKNLLTNNNKPIIESDFESSLNGGFAPVQGNYNNAHNFFTINDAITMPPFMKSTVHTTIVHKPIFNDPTQETPSVSSPVNINLPVETTMKVVQIESTSSEPTQSNIKMRRRYPVTRIQSTNIEKQTQPVKTLNEISIGKQRNITSTIPPSRTMKRPRVNQRKRTRTRTTTESTVRTIASTKDSNIVRDENNVPSVGTISTFTGLSNRLPNRVFKDSLRAENTNSPTIIQTTPALITKPRNTFAPSPPEENFEDAPSSEQSISINAPSTTPLSTQIYSSVNTFNLETSTLDDKNVAESLTKEPVLEAALSTANLERLKTIRLKQRTRTTTTPRTTPAQVPEKIENLPELTTSCTEAPKIVKLRPVSTFELKRPRFSVKDYKTRLRSQSRSSTSTTPQYPVTTPFSERPISKIPTRKRLLATFKSKLPLSESSEKPIEPKTKESLNNSSLETPSARKRNDQNSESYRNAVRMRTSTTSTTESSFSGVPKIRKQLSRPRYSTLKERIQTYKTRKPKPEELESQTSDDLVNITVEVKHDPTTEITKLESAIMKIAKQDPFHRGVFPGLAPQEMMPEENTNGDSSNNSEYVAQLTSGSSIKFNKMKIGGSRGIPEYFTIATDDPILPIEAFFPNVNKE